MISVTNDKTARPMSRCESPIQFGNTHLRDRYIQRTVIHKQNSFESTSRGVQGWTSTDFIFFFAIGLK